MRTERVEERIDDTDGDGRRTVVTSETTPAVTEREEFETVGEERVVHANPWSMTQGFIRTISMVLFAILAIVETMLAFRLGFLAAGANPANNFVEFIYDSTNWLVDPFGGIIANGSVGNDGTFEYATVIAMVVYAVAAGLFVILLSAITSFPSSAAGERSSVTRTAQTERTAHDH